MLKLLHEYMTLTFTRGNGAWHPLEVTLIRVGDPWAHPFYRASTLAEDLTEAYRPSVGFVVQDRHSDEELGLVFQMPKAAAENHVRFRASKAEINVSSPQDVPKLFDPMFESAPMSYRWASVRPDSVVFYFRAKRYEAVEDVLRCRRRPREWSGGNAVLAPVPAPVPEDAALSPADQAALEGLV